MGETKTKVDIFNGYFWFSRFWDFSIVRTSRDRRFSKQNLAPKIFCLVILFRQAFKHHDQVVFDDSLCQTRTLDRNN